MALVAVALWFIPAKIAARSRPRAAPRTFSARANSQQTDVVVPRELKVSASVHGRIKGGETESFTLSLTSGQYAAIEIEQHGSELWATLFDPNSRELLEMDYPGGGYGPIYLSHIAAASGNYRIEIRSVNSWALETPFDLLLKTVRTAEPADETVARAQSLFYEAGKKDRLKNQKAAAELYTQSLALWEGLGDSHWQSLTQFRLALLYGRGSSEDRARSEACLRATLTILQTASNEKDWRLLASTWNELGVFDGRAGQIAQARDELKQALGIYLDHQDRRGQASALSNLASQDQRLGDLSPAREKLQKALELRRAENDKPRELNALNGLAVLSDRLGEPDQALSVLTQVLQRWREIPANDLPGNYRETISAILNNIAATNDKLGNWDQAPVYYDAALNELGKENPESASTLDNYGEHYASLGDLVRAREFYEQALALLPPSSKPNPDIKAGILVHLGQLSIVEGTLPSAVEKFQQARDLNPNPPKMVDVLTNLGYAYVLQANVKKGLAAYDEAWKIQSGLKTEDRRAQASILQKRAETLSLLGRPTEALSDLTRALELWNAVKSRRDEASANFDLASIEGKEGNLRSALAHNEQAIAIVESLRENISNLRLRTSYFEQQQDYYALDIELKMRLNADRPNSEYAGLALESAEKSRARVLLEVLSEAGVRVDCNPIQNQKPSALVVERCALQQKLAAKANARTNLLNGPHSPQQVALMDREINEINDKYEVIETQIRLQSPSFASLTKPKPVASKQIQEQLDGDTALIEYSLQDRRSFLWVVTQQSIRPFELPARAEIEDAAHRFMTALTARNLEVKDETPAQRSVRRMQADATSAEAGAALSKIILEPAASLLGQKRLVIVPDGALQTVAFAALPATGSKNLTANQTTNSSVPQRRLVDDHEMVSLPSASVLALQRRELEARKSAPHAVAVLANPVFTADDQRVRSAR